MVVYLRRDATHNQQSVYLDYLTHMNPAVHQVQQYLVTHPSSSVTLPQLARMVAMSERNLTRLFRRATGISIHEYRERLRLQRAADLLQSPSLSLEQIAAHCGFADARQLRRLWKARFGSTPGYARRKTTLQPAAYP
jgi:transcriptional regulator GlxA family with amidase domain